MLMRIFTYFLSIFLICIPVSAKEFRIDFSDEGMKSFKKKGLGKKTIYTNGKDDKGYFGSTKIALKTKRAITKVNMKISKTRGTKGELQQLIRYVINIFFILYSKFFSSLNL